MKSTCFTCPSLESTSYVASLYSYVASLYSYVASLYSYVASLYSYIAGRLFWKRMVSIEHLFQPLLVLKDIKAMGPKPGSLINTITMYSSQSTNSSIPHIYLKLHCGVASNYQIISELPKVEVKVFNTELWLTCFRLYFSPYSFVHALQYILITMSLIRHSHTFSNQLVRLYGIINLSLSLSIKVSLFVCFSTCFSQTESDRH